MENKIQDIPPFQTFLKDEIKISNIFDRLILK